MKLEDFLDNQKHRVQLELEPQGLLLAEVRVRAHTEEGWSIHKMVEGHLPSNHKRCTVNARISVLYLEIKCGVCCVVFVLTR